MQADLGGGAAVVQSLAKDAVSAAGGPIDILVNNAAAAPMGSLVEVAEEQIDQALAVNIKVPFLLTAALVPAMIERGGGAVINMGSINGVNGWAGAALYGASKAGLHSLTKNFAAELASKGVRVNTVAPGPTVTELQTAEHQKFLGEMTTAHPAGRPGRAEEVAAAVVFLASDDAAHIHGVTLPVDGGALTR